MKRAILRMLLLLLVLLVVSFGVSAAVLWKESQVTKVVFLDVGQGDAILISQGRNQILIDGGRDGKTLLSALSRHIPFWDRRIESVIATHEDADHIGGFSALFSRYEVGMFFANTPSKETDSWKLLSRSAGDSKVFSERLEAREGLSFGLPLGGALSVLFPGPGEIPSESNERSVVSRFSFGETDFLLTGDLPREEAFLPHPPESEILKLSHHGSKYSSSEAFLSLVNPKEAVVSVGENNYGHPAPETLDRVRAFGAVLRRTDAEGDIVYRCDVYLGRCSDSR